MPNWKEILNEAQTVGGTFDVIRRRYLAELHERTGRNVIIYYSGWLEKSAVAGQNPNLFAITDVDKNGFMATIHELDRDKGLDLFLHTPGGDIAATESLVDYLRAMFSDIRVVVPQIAMSAGTMIALASKVVLMGKHSSLGPIDPQIGGIAAHGIIEEFDRAREEIQRDGGVAVELWRPIIAKYSPTLIGACRKSIDWSSEMVKQWLISGMFSGDPDAQTKAEAIVRELGDHALTKSHSRHISAARAKEFGINVLELESDHGLQNAVLTVHHATIQTLATTSAIKITENHKGVSFIQAL